jgi:hypothetical protein
VKTVATLDTPFEFPAWGTALYEFIAHLDEMICAWHSNCRSAAAGTCLHPVLGKVAICPRCAEHDRLAMTPFAPLLAVA